MKVRLFFVSLFLIAASQVNMNAQSFGSGWKCDYATWDEQPNSAGYNVVSVGTIKENCFVALVMPTQTPVKAGLALMLTARLQRDIKQNGLRDLMKCLC